MTNKKPIAIKHCGFSGDVIASLPAIKKATEIYQTKADIYLFLNRSWEVYDSETRATKGLLNQDSFRFLKPLLEALPYVNEVKVWNGEKIHYDFDVVKQMGQSIGLPHSNISRWYMYAFPELQADISIWTIDNFDVIHEHKSDYANAVQEKAGRGILVNRSLRWMNPYINYVFLQHLDLPVYFIGTLEEYELFMNQVPKAERIEVADALDMALWITSAKLFIGNQSLAYNIAEQMKSTRLLECCKEATNVIPTGGRGYDFYTQHGLETLVNQLITEKQS